MLWIVAATGPSLSSEVAERCKGYNVVAVNDAYKLFPFARMLYAADDEWWKLHKGCPEFTGEKWSTCHDLYKNSAAELYGLRLIPSVRRAQGFSFVPGIIHLGGNSGFQAVNLALQKGATIVVLVGFDMQGSHFFGDHPPMGRRMPSNGKGFIRWRKHFGIAADMLPADRKIINATPDSALTCFPKMTLEEALAHA